jgi:uncharacterized membrane protein YphA (DoxX/SURF4 family)
MKFLLHPAVQFIARLILGGIFIYASIDKILHPGDFAKAVANYKALASPVLINLVGVILPWCELLAGAFLIVRVWAKGAWTVLTGLTAVFIVLIAVTMIRGIDVNCGCFSATGATKVGLDLLVRDILLLVPAALAFPGLRRSGAKLEAGDSNLEPLASSLEPRASSLDS